ncbi:peptide chain release factor H [Chitinophaga pinensis]|uniref:Peptide chain release factor H n=1 Tax=Chitinophaga pinensis (strain ATCC 43595 / DSM 2588 / LMG 13176 / NBRC 15968 / NCIMB 11800 / UQM 2034) TaxID=485918 RepID=A0A979H0B8_CHIPD|nr:peptide chain release factor H [Chitinophaga pinensis]ACU64671.1 peptide chain release factor H [Chitinophaga pinensis DSM 2588]
MNKSIIQVTAGRGPEECSRVVARVVEMMMKDARGKALDITLLESTKGHLKGTLLSAVLLIQTGGISSNKTLEAFIQEWRGTIQWVAQSPFRKYHKRKNWFVGVEVFDVNKQQEWNLKDVKLESCRASGPGGQHVNKVETAVRGTHLPSGMQVLAMDSRSQLENKQLCLKRLEAKFMAWQMEQLLAKQQDQWQEHNELERGRAVKVITDKL